MRWSLGRSRRRALDDARRYNRRHRRASSETSGHDFSISCSLGGFGQVSVPWSGESYEDARDSFLEYLTNHAEFDELGDPRFARYRSLYVNFHGQVRLLTFRTDWISGFTVS